MGRGGADLSEVLTAASWGSPGSKLSCRLGHEFRTADAPGLVWGSGWLLGMSPESSRRDVGEICGALGELWDYLGGGFGPKWYFLFFQIGKSAREVFSLKKEKKRLVSDSNR